MMIKANKNAIMKDCLFHKYLNHNLILQILINNFNVNNTIFHEIKNDIYHQYLINYDVFTMMNDLISTLKL
jgi:hypothetical protein